MKNPENELKRRRFLLTGSYIPVIFSVAIPLLSNTWLNIIFQFFDIFTAANMNMNVVTTVSFVTEIKASVSTVCGGLCVGAGIMISRSFGRGDMDEVRSQISTVFFIGIFAAVLLIASTLPFSAMILRLCSLPEELIPSSVIFFIISIFTIVFGFINSIFFATEKARGRTKIIMYANLLIIIIKTSLNAIIIALVSTQTLAPSLAMYFLPVASGLSYGTVTVIALKRMFSPSNFFRVSWRCTNFRKAFLLPLTKLSFPVFIEKFLVPFGKVVCNGLYLGFGSIGIAAFSCTQRIVSLATTSLVSFKDAESTIVSANLGNRNARRAVFFLLHTSFVSFVVGSLLFLLTVVFSEQLIHFFAKENLELADSMRIIYRIQRWDAIFVAIDGAACGFLYANKKTKLPTIVNIVKLFGVRIPFFLLLTRLYGFGIEAIAWSILASNGVDALLSIVFVIHALFDLKRTSAIEASNNERLFSAIKALGKWDAFDEFQANRYGIKVPAEVLETMRKKFGASLTSKEMADSYKEAIVEARIMELEKIEEEAASSL